MASITKETTLKQWAALPPQQDPLQHMEAIPYKASGSRYGACGIRIDGTPAFIDAVLSNLKTLLDGENGSTRLELARRDVEPVLEVHGERKVFANTANGAQVCYIRLHERGHEAKMVNAFMRMVTAEAAKPS